MKKINVIFLFLFIIIVISYIYLKFKPHNYEKNYVVDKFKIMEKYDSHNGSYTFLISNENITYPYLIFSNSFSKREIINKIGTYTNDNEDCILPQSDYALFYPICIKDNELITYDLSNKNIDTFKYETIPNNQMNNDKIVVNYLNDSKYLLYNYKGFYYVNETSIKDIKIFDKDIYTLDLIYQINEYILIPNYNETHHFSKIYVLNIKNGKVETIELDKIISFDSVFLGDYKNKIYLLDKKEEKEYIIDYKKKKVIETEFVILKDNKLIETSYKEIVNNNLKFDMNDTSYFEIIDQKLYQIVDEHKILITNKSVDKIIKDNKDTVYYLCAENLYMYNNTYGEVLLMSNFEWNFNNTNMIYLYK